MPTYYESVTLYAQLLEAHRSGVDLTSVDSDGLTVLHHAAALGKKRIVKYLIEQGRSPSSHVAFICPLIRVC